MAIQCGMTTLIMISEVGNIPPIYIIKFNTLFIAFDDVEYYHYRITSVCEIR